MKETFFENALFAGFDNSKTFARVDRYGFNGQERDDEVAGAGNITTAEFWEYDSRLGRRWNLDPKPQITLSDYVSAPFIGLGKIRQFTSNEMKTLQITSLLVSPMFHPIL